MPLQTSPMLTSRPGLRSILAGCLLLTLSTANAQLGIKMSNKATNSPAIVVKNHPSLVPTTGMTNVGSIPT